MWNKVDFPFNGNFLSLIYVFIYFTFFFRSHVVFLFFFEFYLKWWWKEKKDFFKNRNKTTITGIWKHEEGGVHVSHPWYEPVNATAPPKGHGENLLNLVLRSLAIPLPLTVIVIPSSLDQKLFSRNDP